MPIVEALTDDADFALAPLPTRTGRLLLFVAMQAEAEPVAAALALKSVGPDASGMSVWEGKRAATVVTLVTAGRDPLLGVDRIGPVSAAWTLTTALVAQRPDLVVNIGSAGGFQSRGLAVMDLVVGSCSQFHDARVALPGFDRAARAHTRLSLDGRACSELASALGARHGPVTTGSSLDATPAELAWFQASTVMAKDMELAALASVCRAHATPLVALKGITDLVDHSEPTAEAFTRNLAATTARLAIAAPTMIDWLIGAGR